MAPGYGGMPLGPAPNTTVAYILGAVTIFLCCMPGGIVALMLAGQAKTAVTAGDYEKARSRLFWSYAVSGASVVLGMLVWLVYVVSGAAGSGGY